MLLSADQLMVDIQTVLQYMNSLLRPCIAKWFKFAVSILILSQVKRSKSSLNINWYYATVTVNQEKDLLSFLIISCS